MELNAEPRTRLIAKYKDSIEDSVRNSKFYEFDKGADYVLGFQGHNGMVSRIEKNSLTGWINGNLRPSVGRTCIIDHVCEISETWSSNKGMSSHTVLCSSTVLNEILYSYDKYSVITDDEDRCVYIPRVAIIDDGNWDCLGYTDVIYGKLPVYDGNYAQDFETFESLNNRLQLAIHAAACNRVDKLVYVDYNHRMAKDDIKTIANIVHDFSSLYKCYLSNLLYLTPDDFNYEICRGIFESK